jgi:peptidoglycan/LPS O-acetylase OafA/YrhL
MTKTLSSLFCALVIIVLAVLLLDPLRMGMPHMMHATLEVGLLAVFGAFAAFVLQEQRGDEREEMHRQSSGRIAFLSGALILVVGIIYQGFRAAVDPWLVIALAAMLVMKILARCYSDWRR